MNIPRLFPYTGHVHAIINRKQIVYSVENTMSKTRLLFTESSWSAKHCKTAILSIFSVIVLLKSFCLFGNISNITSILLTNKQKNLSFSCKMFQLPFHVYERPKCIENLSLNTRIHAASDWACAGQFKHSGLLLTGVQLVLFVAIHPKTSATG